MGNTSFTTGVAKEPRVCMSNPSLAASPGSSYETLEKRFDILTGLLAVT
jgi:hypothetical protein